MYKKTKTSVYNLLKKSERWTKTDMIYLAKNGFWLNLSKIIGMTTSFALAVAYANFLDKQDYATYKYIISTIALFGFISLPGLNTALLKSMAQGYDGSQKKVVTSKYIFGIFLLLIFGGISIYYFFQENSLLAYSFAVSAILTYIKNGLVYDPYLQSRKLYKKISVYNIVTAIVTALSIITTLVLSNNFLLLISVYFSSTTLTSIIFYILTFKDAQLNSKEDKRTIRYGYHLSFLEVFSTITQNIDKIIIWHFVGAVELAIYSFAIMPVNEIRSLLKTINILAMPKLAKQRINLLKKSLPKKIIKFSLITAAISLVYIVSSKHIFQIFFPEYIESVFYSNVFAISLIFYPISIFHSTFIMKEAKKNLYILMIMPQVLVLSLMITLIPLFGIIGAIYARLLTQFLVGLIAIVLFNKMR